MRVARAAMLAAVVALSAAGAVARDISDGGAGVCGHDGGYVGPYYGSEPLNVRYGTGAKYVTYAGLSHNGGFLYCTATEFGIDPAPGEQKYCYCIGQAADVATDPPPPAPEDLPGMSWSSAAHLGQVAGVLALVAFMWLGYRAGERGPV